MLESSVSRIVSDIESEKGTRVRTNATILEAISKVDDRVRRCEWLIALGMGGLAVIEFFARLLK